MHILLMQLFVPANRIWCNSALNTFLIVHGNYSTSVIDKEKKNGHVMISKCKFNREGKRL